MAELDRLTQATQAIKLTNSDETLVVDVKQVDGQNRILTDSNISSINVPLGKDPLCDSYFTITNAGSIGDTITIDLSATNNDGSSPDVDFPAYQYVYTLIAADVGNEQQLAINLANALNNDALFEAQDLEAFALPEDDDNKRPIVHITSTKFSLNGEFYERDFFDVTTTGTTTVLFFSTDYNKLVSRPKEVSLARDPRNPHRLGVQSISGSVFIRSTDPEKLIREYLTNNGSNEMAVNGGAGTVFEITSKPDGDSDIIIDNLKWIISDGNIKVARSNFLGLNNALSSGILVELIRDGVAIFTETLFDTLDMLGGFSNSASDNKILNYSGGDYLESSFSLINSNLAFVLRNGENDAVRVTIRDNLSQVSTIKLLVTGSEE